MRAMVMAAGLGTRLAPLTDHLPKPLVPVCNRPVLEHLLRRIAAAGVRHVAVNLHHHADAIRDTFGDGGRLGLEIHWSYEETLLGTAGGTRRCADVLLADGEPFLVTSADGLHDVDLVALMARHRAAGALATLTVKRVPDPHRYGICVLDERDEIIGFQEKPPPELARSDLASLGVYAFDPRIVERMAPDTFLDWAKDVLPSALADGERLAAYRSDAYWSDVGSVEELVRGNLDPLRGLLRLDLGEPVASDAIVQPGADLDGPVLVGAAARIEAGATVVGPCVVGPEACVRAGAALRGAVVLPGAEVPQGSIVMGGVVGDASALDGIWRRHAGP